MKEFCLTSLILLFFVSSLEAQKERKLIREGVREYEKEKYGNAEISFRKALDKNQNSYPADYNVGNSLYKQNKYKEASEKFGDLSKKDVNKEQLSDVYHNLGNSYLQGKQYDKSIEAYKNSLRLRPDDEDTRYNLAYALSMLKQQQQQQQNQSKNNQDQDKKDEQDNDKQDQQQKQDQKQDQQKQQQQEQKDQLTKQEAEQILEAIQNQEKMVQEKVERQKAKAAKVYTDKDW